MQQEVCDGLGGLLRGLGEIERPTRSSGRGRVAHPEVSEGLRGQLGSPGGV